MKKLVAAALSCMIWSQMAFADHPFVDWRTFLFSPMEEPNIDYGFGLFPFMQQAKLTGTFELGIDHELAFLRNVNVAVTDAQWIDLTTGEVVQREEPGPLIEGARLVDLVFNDIREIDGRIPDFVDDGLLTMEFSVVDPPDDEFTIRNETNLIFTFDAGFFDSTRVELRAGSGSINVADGPWVGIDNAVAQPIVFGDFDSDGLLDANDIDLLSLQIRSNLFDPAFDVNFDGTLDEADHARWVVVLKKTWLGDANLDGQFNSRDFVAIFQLGEYEDDQLENSGWASGDWNGDAEFDSGDLVAALQEGGYEAGPRMGPAVNIPEPASILLLYLGLACYVAFARRLGAQLP